MAMGNLVLPVRGGVEMLRNSTNRRKYTKKKVSVPVVTVRLAVTSSSVRGGLNSNVVLGDIVGLNTTIVHNLEL